MMQSRRLGDVELIQLVEFSGPTHDAEWMLPGVPPQDLAANMSWLTPRFWMPRTNRLVFTMQVWLLKMGERVILVDTGVGNGKPRPSPRQHMINTPFIDWLEAVGAPPGKVTDVVHTHLHGDHVGWNTQRVDGRWAPTFPNARYFLPKGDWDAYRPRYDAGEHGLLGGSFADSVLPIMEAGLARLFEPGDDVADCLRAVAAPGHTPGQVTLSLYRDGAEYIFAGDVLHSPVQVLRPDINSRWCELPECARKTRRALLEHAAATGATLFPAHALGLDGWHVARRGEGFVGRFAGPPEAAIDAAA